MNSQRKIGFFGDPFLNIFDFQATSFFILFNNTSNGERI